MQIFLCSEGEVTGPFTSDQLHRMQENKEIGAHMLYWCEGMEQWEKFRPKKDLDLVSAVKKDAHFPFESGTPPPPPPWEKTNVPLRIAVLVSLLVGIGVFALAWEKHSMAARAEVTRSLMVLNTADKIRGEIKQGSCYKQEEWPKVAAVAGITDMESAQEILGGPNQISDNGYRWIYFDRMIHPVTGMETDMSVRFDTKKKVVGFSPYP